jgi:sorting nexin-1/2
MGNKDDKFVEERRSLLERFMKELSKFEYLTQSKEFKVFARDRGDIDKILGSMIRQTPLQILEKYRQHFNIDDSSMDAADLAQYKENNCETVQVKSNFKIIFKNKIRPSGHQLR